MELPKGFDPVAFITCHTSPKPPSFVPEIQLYLADEVTPLWQMTENEFGETNLPPPFWAFAWPGGQGLARYVLDNPEIVSGKRVLDFASGGGVASIATAKAGAKSAMCCDIDPLAKVALELNAGLNEVLVKDIGPISMERPLKGVDIIMAGDVCYQQAMSVAVMRWLRLCKEAGTRVLLADPGRAWLPKEGMTELAQYVIPTSRDLEDQEERLVVIWDLQAVF